jgi:hypothetical protein
MILDGWERDTDLDTGRLSGNLSNDGEILRLHASILKSGAWASQRKRSQKGPLGAGLPPMSFHEAHKWKAPSILNLQTISECPDLQTTSHNEDRQQKAT